MKATMENLKDFGRASVLLVAMVPFCTVSFFALDRWAIPNVVAFLETLMR